MKFTFGCFESVPDPEPVPADVQALIDQRKTARDAKDFNESDRLRDAIKERGWEVKDTGQGQVIRKALYR